MNEDPKFVSTLTKEFCKVLDAVVDEEIEPPDCYEPLLKVLGKPITRDKLAAVTGAQRKELWKAFVEWFECDTIQPDDIQEAIEATLSRSAA